MCGQRMCSQSGTQLCCLLSPAAAAPAQSLDGALEPVTPSWSCTITFHVASPSSVPPGRRHLGLRFQGVFGSSTRSGCGRAVCWGAAGASASGSRHLCGRRCFFPYGSAGSGTAEETMSWCARGFESSGGHRKRQSLWCGSHEHAKRPQGPARVTGAERVRTTLAACSERPTLRSYTSAGAKPQAGNVPGVQDGAGLGKQRGFQQWAKCMDTARRIRLCVTGGRSNRCQAVQPMQLERICG